MSRVCEEFDCLPDAARYALDNDPDQMIPTILMLRAFARTKEVYDRAESKFDLPQNRMMDLLQEIEFEHVKDLRADGDEE